MHFVHIHPTHSLFPERLLCPEYWTCLGSSSASLCGCYSNHQGSVYKGGGSPLWGGIFPASVQSTAENKSPNTPEETRSKAFYQPKHRAGPEESRIVATFLPCRKTIPEQLVGARTVHSLDYSLFPSPPALCLNDLKASVSDSLASNYALTENQRLQMLLPPSSSWRQRQHVIGTTNGVMVQPRP